MASVDLFMYVDSFIKFVVAGNEVGPILPAPGLRHGDPISPYLFLICAESLSALIHKKQVTGAIHGGKIANGAPIITHLFFVDDFYLIFRATTKEAESIQECLMLYEKASGQQVNFLKSAISFSRNTLKTDKDAITKVLQVSVRNDSMYHSLPKTISRNKWRMFRYV